MSNLMRRKKLMARDAVLTANYLDDKSTCVISDIRPHTVDEQLPKYLYVASSNALV